MPKFYSNVGYLMTEETSPGIWTETLVERPYYGDLTRLSSSYQNQSKLNDDIRISNSFSIVADPFAYENFCNMRYVTYMGVKLKIESVDVSQPPRIIIQASSKYNDPNDADE